MRHSNLRVFFATIALLAIVSLLSATDTPFTNTPVTVGQSSNAPAVPSPYAQPIPDGSKIQGTIDVDTTLNVRDAPWGTIIGSLKAGDKVTIIGQVGDWYKINWNGRVAYIHSAYCLRPGEPAKPFIRSGWINAPLGVNVRRTPGGDVIGQLKDQMQVEILGVTGKWVKIKYNNNEAFVSIDYVDAGVPKKPEGDGVTPMTGTGVVTAEVGLNVRSSPWGGILNVLPNGAKVQITGKIDDWYRINYNGKTAYVHSNYIDRGGTGTTPQPTDPGPAGSQQQRIAKCAKDLVGSTRFRGPEVDYGNLACAQVVSTALKNAGVLPAAVLNVRSVVSQLKDRGWVEVHPPPYQEGDVITWKTYDYTGDGVKDPDTHVGIMVKDGNTFKAMNNSSRLRMPRLTDANIAPVTRVLRKVA